MKKPYEPPVIIDTYKDMKEFVLMHICYACPFNQKETPKDYDCINLDKFMGDDCPIWIELCEVYL